MPELSLQNIDQISQDIRKQEITFSHLLDELTDHICCDVEYEMQQGKSFQDAYIMVKKKMGNRRLKEIQEETLFAVDTKYRQMKTTMKISGVAGTIMFGLAALFKIQHWPGAGILMTLGALTLALIFLPSALSVLWKETHNTKRLFLFISAFVTGACFIAGTLFKINHWPLAGFFLIGGAISGIFLFIPALLINRLQDIENKTKRPVYVIGAAGVILYIAGLLFKIQHWPLATVFIVTGIIMLSVIAFPWYTWLTWKEDNHVSHMFIYMVIGSLLLIIPGALVTLNLQRTYQDRYYTNNNQQNAMYDYLFTHNHSIVGIYHDSLCYSKLEQLHSRTVQLLSVIGSVQENMVQESEGKPGKATVTSDAGQQVEPGHEIVYKELKRPFYQLSYRDHFSPGSKLRNDIDGAMKEYNDYLIMIVPDNDILRYKKLLAPTTYLAGDETPDRVISLMSGLHNLEVMKNGILTVESCVLNEIVRVK
jgi:hypothetical protein